MGKEINKEYIRISRDIFDKTLHFVLQDKPDKALEFFEKAFKILDGDAQNGN